ncbi:MAG TPA: alpha/beta hydrolase [Polyangiaceae bacterium]|jgi:pimeloyl-ACP methyl ester carboxylesterase|nr:alpha/beta hydrolase [Polyangiaceae bacterium]
MKRGIANADGVELAYSVEGTADDSILLIMGLGGRAADWGTRFPALLAERYRVIRLDNRGVGASPPAPGGYVLDDLARDATRVLDAVGVARAHVMGISMGGMISQLVALNHPERVNKLVLLSTHFGGHSLVPPHPDAMRLFDQEEFVKRGKDPLAMMRFTLSVITAPGFIERTPEALNEILRNVEKEPTSQRAFLAQVQAIIGSDRSERVTHITQPTMVVHGDEDKLIPFENGKRLGDAIPGAKFARLAGVGHMPMFEATNELARLVLDFLGKPE